MTTQDQTESIRTEGMMSADQAKQAMADAAHALDFHGATRTEIAEIIREALGPSRSKQEIHQKAIEHLMIGRDLLDGVDPAVVFTRFGRGRMNPQKAIATAVRKARRFTCCGKIGDFPVSDEANKDRWIALINEALTAAEALDFLTTVDEDH